MNGLPATGERVIEDAYRSSPGRYAIYLMHLASYRFAMRFTRDMRVLELGCGSGYGSALISETARNVVAVDVSEEAVRYAATHHARENLVYRLVSPGDDLPFSEGSFDVVLSFQVIEHVEDDRHYVQQAGRVLKPGGVLIVVTPNRDVRLMPGQKPWNRWHIREYDGAGLASLFSPECFRLEMKFMSASKRVAELEVRRYRRLKWLTLPVTLPFMPDSWRLCALHAMHAFDRHPAKPPKPMAKLPFDESEVTIGDQPHMALNLVAIATKRLAE